MSVNEYVTKFTQLSRYAPHKIDTDEKKHECFLNGLNDGLTYASEAPEFENFQGMVNKALVLENRRGVIEHKRKLVHQHQLGSSSRPRVATPSARYVFHPTQLQPKQRPQSVGQGFSTRQRQDVHHPNNFESPTVGSQNVQRTQAAQDPLFTDCRCFNSGEKGHYANRCPIPRTRAHQTATATPAPTRGANSVPVATK
jgi:hypothetical protein